MTTDSQFAPSSEGADIPVTDLMLLAYSEFDTNGHAAPPVMRMARELIQARACIREQKADAVMLIEAGMPHNFKYGYVTVRVPK